MVILTKGKVFMRQVITVSQIYISILVFLVLVMLVVSMGKPAESASPATRIETDQKTGAMLFIVNGQEEAQLDANGLHVRQSVQYGGTMTDVGVSSYDRFSPVAAASAVRATGKGKP
jgi:hypothetical protein